MRRRNSLKLENSINNHQLGKWIDYRYVKDDKKSTKNVNHQQVCKIRVMDLKKKLQDGENKKYKAKEAED